MPSQIDMTRRGRFLLKGALVWLLMPIAAIANGALRDLLVAPLLGERGAEILAVLVLLILIYGITAVFLTRAGPRRRSADLWALGFLWMVLTIAFELVFFGVFLSVPVPELITAYNIFAGELWIVVVIGVLLAPRLVQMGLRLIRQRH
jgi:hypothetical protein